MRLLVACPDCQRKYDATGRKIDSLFHCHCGSEVRVVAPRGHDASIVRCSACGAPREEHASACVFCKADFTLHEQDLHTICPSCLSRVSDRARFCHHCGGNLSAESTSVNVSDLSCPHCQNDQKLSHRQIGADKIPVLECNLCAGLWLGSNTFDELTKKASDQVIVIEDFVTDTAANVKPDESGKWKYRTCPQCPNLMQRRHYAKKSRVIIDVCREHGVWLDAHELPRILRFIREGGLIQATREQQEKMKKEAKRQKQERAAASGDQFGSSPSSFAGESMVEILIQSIFHFSPNYS